MKNHDSIDLRENVIKTIDFLLVFVRQSIAQTAIRNRDFVLNFFILGNPICCFKCQKRCFKEEEEFYIKFLNIKKCSLRTLVDEIFCSSNKLFLLMLLFFSLSLSLQFRSVIYTYLLYDLSSKHCMCNSSKNSLLN